MKSIDYILPTFWKGHNATFVEIVQLLREKVFQVRSDIVNQIKELPVEIVLELPEQMVIRRRKVWGVR